MRKRKLKKPANLTAADLPQNPEFQEFVRHVQQISSVPKSEIDRLIAEEKEAKKPPICE